MKKIIGLTLCLGLTGIALAEEPAAPANTNEKTLLTINGRPINGTDMLIFNAQQGGKAIDSEQAQVALMNQIINTVVVAQMAETNKLTDDPKVKSAVAIARLQVLAEIQAQTYLSNNPVSDEQVKVAYDKQFSPENMMEYSVSHILVDSEAKAKESIAALDKGGDFAALAKENSADASKDIGGDLGWIEAGQVIKPFSDAMKSLKKGEYTKAPVATQYGWHVIKLTDSRAKTAPSLDDVKTQLAARLQQEQLGKYIKELRGQAKIDIEGQQKKAVEQPAQK